jgi:hypothetical protein
MPRPTHLSTLAGSAAKVKLWCSADPRCVVWISLRVRVTGSSSDRLVDRISDHAAKSHWRKSWPIRQNKTRKPRAPTGCGRDTRPATPPARYPGEHRAFSMLAYVWRTTRDAGTGAALVGFSIMGSAIVEGGWWSPSRTAHAFGWGGLLLVRPYQCSAIITND